MWTGRCPRDRVEPGEDRFLLFTGQTVPESPGGVTGHRGEESVQAREPSDHVLVGFIAAFDVLEGTRELGDELSHVLARDLRRDGAHEDGIVTEGLDLEAEPRDQLRRFADRSDGRRRELDRERREEPLSSHPVL